MVGNRVSLLCNRVINRTPGQEVTIRGVPRNYRTGRIKPGSIHFNPDTDGRRHQGRVPLRGDCQLQRCLGYFRGRSGRYYRTSPVCAPTAAGTAVQRSLAGRSTHEIAYRYCGLVNAACRVTALGRHAVGIGSTGLVINGSYCYSRSRECCGCYSIQWWGCRAAGKKYCHNTDDRENYRGFVHVMELSAVTIIKPMETTAETKYFCI